MSAEAYKRAAAARAVEFVRPGMRLGLGTGSTAQAFVELLAERVKAGLDVRSPRSTIRPSSTSPSTAPMRSDPIWP
jgi:ribose 5-phosphate isomerase